MSLSSFGKKSLGESDVNMNHGKNVPCNVNAQYFFWIPQNLVTSVAIINIRKKEKIVLFLKNFGKERAEMYWDVQSKVQIAEYISTN